MTSATTAAVTMLVIDADAKVAKQAYKNRRAELYGTLRELMDPDREGGAFALPPDGHQLREELAVLPLQYDSEGKLYLPPKDSTSARATGQRSLRQLLGRSPDRADSLVLGACGHWGSPRRVYDEPLICSGEDPVEERRPFTDEELEELPEEWRELVVEMRASGAEKRRQMQWMTTTGDDRHYGAAGGRETR